MYGQLTGFSGTDGVSFRPRCGSRIGICFSGCTAKREGCGIRFGVIESEDSHAPEDGKGAV